MTSNLQLRQRIAQLGARLMVQEAIADYQKAKYKAAAQLGVPNSKHLPSNREIEEEILIYQRLFNADTQHLKQHRRTALEAMHLLAKFTPRLVGTVLEGTAHSYSNITLHVFSHTPEDVALFLRDNGIPYELNEQRFRLPQLVSYPRYQFMAGEEKIWLVVFGIDDIRWTPPSPIDGKPMRRADIATVERLI